MCVFVYIWWTKGGLQCHFLCYIMYEQYVCLFVLLWDSFILSVWYYWSFCVLLQSLKTILSLCLPTKCDFITERTCELELQMITVVHLSKPFTLKTNVFLFDCTFCSFLLCSVTQFQALKGPIYFNDTATLWLLIRE